MRGFLAIGMLWLLAGCAPREPSLILLVDEEHPRLIDSGEHVPLLVLTEAQVAVSPDDEVLADGVGTPMDARLERSSGVTLQLRRAAPVVIRTPGGETTLMTTARTVGEALRQAGLELREADAVDPSPSTLLDGAATISLEPAREYTVTYGGHEARIWSAARTVGDVLAGTELAPIGLDITVPAEAEPVPADGHISLIRVREETVLALETVPFESEFRSSAEIELGEEVVVQAGIPGLAMTRTHIRYEGGTEVARSEESRSIVRAPRARIVEQGTKIVLKSTVVDAVPIQYWRAVEMYATSYSPCRSGVQGQCFSGTSYGLPVKKGVVAVDTTVYSQLAGQQIYVAGYGPAVIADIGGGSIVEASIGVPRTRWIDLGYSDADWQEWGRYVTVYFLPPAPAAIPSVLQ